MSVLKCSRNGCDNIMCDRYSAEYSYICNDCFQELVSLGVQTNIEDFLQTTPSKTDLKEASYNYFNSIFKELWWD